MRKLEDAIITYTYSRYHRWLGPDELQDFSIKIGKKQFEEEIFKSGDKMIDLTEYAELDLNHQLQSMINLRQGFLDKIEKDINEKIKNLRQENYFIQKIFSRVGSEKVREAFLVQVRSNIELNYLQHLTIFNNEIERLEKKIQDKLNTLIDPFNLWI